MDEPHWLQSYLQTRSRDALSRLVEHYIHLVYGAALRQVRDQHLAEDITQSVFAILVQKAGGLRPDTVLSAWLLTVTRYVALNALKRESRNKRRELEAARMNSHVANPPSLNRDELVGAVDEA